jgi:hypothetical protein
MLFILCSLLNAPKSALYIAFSIVFLQAFRFPSRGLPEALQYAGQTFSPEQRSGKKRP